MSNKNNAKLYFFSALAVTAVLSALALLTWNINELIIHIFNKTMFTPEQFKDCMKTIALVMFVTTQMPLLSIAIIYWKKSKSNSNDA